MLRNELSLAFDIEILGRERVKNKFNKIFFLSAILKKNIQF